MTPKTYETILNDILKYLKTELNLEDIPDGTVLHALAAAVSLELSRNYQVLGDLILNVFMSQMGGVYLDQLASVFGIERYPARQLTYVGGIEFYTGDGSPLVENGFTPEWLQNNRVIVSDDSGNELEIVVDYPLTSQLVSTEPGGNPVYLQTPTVMAYARPITVKSDSIGKGALNRYAPRLNNVFVRNITDITLIYPQETDEELRYRLAAFIKETRPTTQDAIEAKLRVMPDVQDFKLEPYARGIGTVDIYIVPTDLTQIEATIANVEEELKDILPTGIDFKISAPNLIQVGLVGEVLYETATYEVVYNTVKEAMSDYFASLPLNTLLDADNAALKIQELEYIVSVRDLKLAIYTKSPTDSSGVFRGVFETYACGKYDKPMFHPDETVAMKLTLRSV